MRILPRDTTRCRRATRRKRRKQTSFDCRYTDASVSLSRAPIHKRNSHYIVTQQTHRPHTPSGGKQHTALGPSRTPPAFLHPAPQQSVAGHRVTVQQHRTQSTTRRSHERRHGGRRGRGSGGGEESERNDERSSKFEVRSSKRRSNEATKRRSDEATKRRRRKETFLDTPNERTNERTNERSNDDAFRQLTIDN